MAKTTTERIESIQAEIQQLKNQEKQLVQKQKKQERAERTHRLCKRGGLWESLVPDTITLTDEQFKIFLEKTITTEYARRILDGLAAQNAATAAPQGAETAAQDNAIAMTETPQRERA